MTFISEFKKTDTYRRLIANPNVILMYVGGSQCTGLASTDSDYDIIIITKDSSVIDASTEIFLTYKNKKVHWYYWPINDFITCALDGLWLIGSIYFRNVTSDFIIYRNQSYINLINKLLEKKEHISTLAIYKFFNIKLKYINKLLISGYLMDDLYFHKTNYHIYLAAYYLVDKVLNLTDIKSLKNAAASTAITPQKLTEHLKATLNYLDKFPIDYRKELITLYEEIHEYL